MTKGGVNLLNQLAHAPVPEQHSFNEKDLEEQFSGTSDIGLTNEAHRYMGMLKTLPTADNGAKLNIHLARVKAEQERRKSKSWLDQVGGQLVTPAVTPVTR